MITVEAARLVLQKSANEYARQHQESLHELLATLERQARDSVEVRRPSSHADVPVRPAPQAAPSAAAAAQAPGEHYEDQSMAIMKYMARETLTTTLTIEGRPFCDWLNRDLQGKGPEDIVRFPGTVITITGKQGLDFLNRCFSSTLNGFVGENEQKNAHARLDVEERELTVLKEKQRIEQAAKDAEAERQHKAAKDAEEAKAAEAERQRQAAKDAEAAKAAEAERQRQAAKEAEEAKEQTRKRKRAEEDDLSARFNQAATWLEALPHHGPLAQLRVDSGEYTTLKGAKAVLKKAWTEAKKGDCDPDPTNGTYCLGVPEDTYPEGVPDGVVTHYVGASKNPEARINAHLNGTGSAITHNNPYITERLPLLSPRIIEAGKSTQREIDETLYRMKAHGILHVRGAHFNGDTINPVEAFRLICHNFNLCNRCGVGGHFVAACTDEPFADWNSPF